MLRSFVVLGLVLSNAAWAERSLPRGEESPRAVAAIYSAAQGEVHFLEEKGQLGQALFRLPNGDLLPLVRTEGPHECDRFAAQAVVACAFHFEGHGKTVEVRSEDLSKNLFRSVSRGIQSRIHYVSL